MLSPDVNESMLKFSVNKSGNIRFGLGAVKGVGESAAMHIIEERQNGAFKSIFDFVERIRLFICNRKSIEALALAGAFDNLGIPREAFFYENEKGETFTEVLMRYGFKYQADKNAAACSLFGNDNAVSISKPEIPVCERWNDLERLNREREVTGIYLSAHPLDEYRVILTHVCNAGVSDLNHPETLQGRELLIGGIVIGVQEKMGKSGLYEVVRIEDFTGSAEVCLFGKEYVNFGKYCKTGMYLLIRGRIIPQRWKRDGSLGLHVTLVNLLEEEKDKLIENINITVPIYHLNESIIDELSVLIKNNPGKSLLYFRITDGKDDVSLNLFSKQLRLNVTPALVDFLEGNEYIHFNININ
ncbi:MAG: DNA polymerase III subunit alpha [Bacteroidales bacterium]